MFIHRYCFLQKVQDDSGEIEFLLADLNKNHYTTYNYRPDIVFHFIHPLNRVKGLSFEFMENKFKEGNWRVPTQEDVLKYSCHIYLLLSFN